VVVLPALASPVVAVLVLVRPVAHQPEVVFATDLLLVVVTNHRRADPNPDQVVPQVQAAPTTDLVHLCPNPQPRWPVGPGEPELGLLVVVVVVGSVASVAQVAVAPVAAAEQVAVVLAVLVVPGVAEFAAVPVVVGIAQLVAAAAAVVVPVEWGVAGSGG